MTLLFKTYNKRENNNFIIVQMLNEATKGESIYFLLVTKPTSNILLCSKFMRKGESRMLREKWNDNWTVEDSSSAPLMASLMNEQIEKKVVQLPHDAMIHEERTEKTKNVQQTGFYPGNVYGYEKTFLAPNDWKDKTVTFEFEGVYPQGQVYINGDYAGGHLFGYSNFYVCADDYLKYGEENTIKVIVNNSQELNSRWYSGSGIYRNVNILIGSSTY